MKVIVAREIEYTPEWGGNKDLPTADQCVVTMRYPTVEERKRYVSAQQRFITETRGNDEGRFSVDVNINNEALVERYVVSISNLRVGTDDGDEEVEITNGKQLLGQIGMHELVVELGTEISRMRARAPGLDPRLRSVSGAGAGATGSTERDPAAAQ